MTTPDTAKAGSDEGPAFAIATAQSATPAFVLPHPLPATAEVWLVRHGQTQWSLSGQHTGRTDIDLTPAGRVQAAALRAVFQDMRPSLVLASPRRRAQQTAELAGLAVDAVDPDLSEWDYGDYEGLTTAQIRERDPGWTVWTYPSPNGETAAQVAARADRVLTRAAGAVTATGPVVLFGHGHISRMLGARWVGLHPVDGGRFALTTASTSILGVEHAVPVINQWNVPHSPAQEAS